MIEAISDATDAEWEGIDTIIMATLLELIGKHFIQKNIYHDGLSIKANYKDTDLLATLDSKSFLRDRNQLVLSFINGCCKVAYQGQIENQTLFAISVAVEIIYFICNFNLVLPHCFLLNLLQSSVSDSKTVSALNGKVAPGARYTTYKKRLEEKDKLPLHCPKQDVITFFDNIGKYITRSYCVSTEKVTRADIVTATLHIELGTDLQCQENLKSCNWPQVSDSTQLESMKKIVDESNLNFRQIRLEYIKLILDIVKFENDDIDSLITTQEKMSRLQQC